MKIKWMAALAGSCVLALAVAACGSSGSGSSGSGTSQSSSKSPYIIGSIDTETGVFGSTDAAGALGVEAWAAYVNSHGGINGHPVQLVVKDDQGNPSVALGEVRAFAAEQNLIALVGNISSVETSWAPVAEAEGIPVVGDFPYTPISYSTKYVFPQGTTIGSILYGEAYSAVTLGHATKVGFFYCAEDPACADSVAPIKAFAAADGGTLVNSEAVSATAPNYDAVCTTAKNSGAKALILALGAQTIISLAESCSSVGYNPLYVYQTTALSPQEASVPALENSSLGVVETFPWVDDSTPAQQAFQAGVEEAHVPSSDYGAALSLGWTGGALFQAAMQSVTATATRASVADALWNLPKGTTLDGLAPPLTYAANEPSPQQKCFFVMKLSAGKWTAPYGPTKTFCQPLWQPPTT
jgi:branched-chain amino acid transport system substrate-binding protein